MFRNPRPKESEPNELFPSLFLSPRANRYSVTRCCLYTPRHPPQSDGGSAFSGTSNRNVEANICRHRVSSLTKRAARLFTAAKRAASVPFCFVFWATRNGGKKGRSGAVDLIHAGRSLGSHEDASWICGRDHSVRLVSSPSGEMATHQVDQHVGDDLVGEPVHWTERTGFCCQLFHEHRVHNQRVGQRSLRLCGIHVRCPR